MDLFLYNTQHGIDEGMFHWAFVSRLMFFWMIDVFYVDVVLHFVEVSLGFLLESKLTLWCCYLAGKLSSRLPPLRSRHRTSLVERRAGF